MGFYPFEVTAPHLAYAILGGFTVIFGVLSLAIKERLYLGEAPIATIVGIIIGPYVLNFFDPYEWGGGNQHVTDEITLEVTRVVIAIGVFAVGVELPKAYMKRHWRSLFFLLGPCMVYGWLVSALLIWGMIPGLTYLSSLVIAACVTPTDPILAQAVVGGKFADKHVPTHIRHLLSAESGSNDGAAFPFLYIALYLTLDSSPGHAVGEWFYMIWVYEVLLGIIIGSLLGYTARKVMRYSERKKLIDRQSYVAQYVSLAILSIGICTLLGSDDLLAAFACGCAFAWDGFFNKATEDAVFSNVIDLLFNCAAFIYIGALIPFTSFANAAFHLSVWRLIVLAILILLFRRLPAILALYRWIPDIKTFREAAFVGWFGPMGVGAIFISTLARANIPEPENDGDTSQVDLLQETIGPIVAMLVLSSVLTHGLSIPFFLSGRRVHSITNTWSRNPSMDTRYDRNEPAWTTHTRRLDPASQVVINRDDEEGDVGIIQRPTRFDLGHEKSVTIDDRSNASNGSGDSAAGGSAGDSSTRNGGKDDEVKLDRPRTPPIAVYQEGSDLVVETCKDAAGGDDVDVHVEKGVLKGKGPEDIEMAIVDRTKQAERDAPRRPGTPDSSHSTNFSDHSTNAGSDDEDVGDGFVQRFRPRPYQNVRLQQPSPTGSLGDGYVNRSPYGSWSVHEDHPGTPERVSTVSATNRGPSIHSYIPASRIKKEDRSGGWRRFLRVGTTSSNHSAAEEGRSESPEPGFLSVPTHHSQMPARVRTIEPDREAFERGGGGGGGGGGGDGGGGDGGDGNDRSLQLTRTLSRAISFAPETAVSSDTAPNMSNYGNSNPTFKRNPGLSMYRTSSVRSIDEDESQVAPA